MDKYEVRRRKLLDLIKRDGGVVSAFAAKIDKNPSYVSRMAYPEGKAGKKRIGDDMCEHIQRCLNLNDTFFYSYEPTEVGTMSSNTVSTTHKDGKPAIISLQGEPTNDDEVTIPQYHDHGGAMGNGVLLRDQPGKITKWSVSQEWATKNIPPNSGIDHICVVTGFGDSMKGLFNSGDPLLVDTAVKTVEFDSVYFFRVKDEGFIKRLQRIPGEGLRVLSENKSYDPWAITPDMDFEVFGRVLKVWKSEEF